MTSPAAPSNPNESAELTCAALHSPGLVALRRVYARGQLSLPAVETFPFAQLTLDKIKYLVKHVRPVRFSYTAVANWAFGTCGRVKKLPLGIDSHLTESLDMQLLDDTVVMCFFEHNHTYDEDIEMLARDTRIQIVSQLHEAPRWVEYTCAETRRYTMCMELASVEGSWRTVLALARHQKVQRYMDLPIDVARLHLLTKHTGGSLDQTMFLQHMLETFPDFFGDDLNKKELPAWVQYCIPLHHVRRTLLNVRELIAETPLSKVSALSRITDPDARNKARLMVFLGGMRLHRIWGTGAAPLLKKRVWSFLCRSDP